MTGLERRVRRLERVQGIGAAESAFCSCEADRYTVRWNDGRECLPETCPKCGRPRRVIEIEWVDGPSWRRGLGR